MFARNFEHPLAAANPGVVSRGQRQITKADGVLLHRAPVIGIELTLEHPARPVRQVANTFQAFEGRLGNHLEQVVVRGAQHGYGFLRAEPAIEAMTRRINPELGQVPVGFGR